MPLPSTCCLNLGVNLDFSSSFRLLNPVCQPFSHRPCPRPSPAPRAQSTVLASWTPLHGHSSPSAQGIFKKCSSDLAPLLLLKSFRTFLSPQNKIRALPLAYRAHSSARPTSLSQLLHFSFSVHASRTARLTPDLLKSFPVLRTPGLRLFAQQASSRLC